MQRHKDSLQVLRTFIRGQEHAGEGGNFYHVSNFLYNKRMNNVVAWRRLVGKNSLPVVMVRDSRYSQAVAGRDNVVIATTAEASQATSEMLRSYRNVATKRFTREFLKKESNFNVDGLTLELKKPKRLRGSQMRLFIDLSSEVLMPGHRVGNVEEQPDKFILKYY